MDRKFHEYLRKAFDARSVSDYDTGEVPVELAKEQLDHADEFIAMAEAWLDTH